MILGITGGFGCGKSSVLHFFKSRSWFVLDADAVCRSFYDDRHPQLFDCIQKNFGNDVFGIDGAIDRRKLGQILFDSPEKMSVITDVLYPLLTDELSKRIADCRKKNINGAFELPLLYEAGFENCFDKILAVWCPAELRKKRLTGRNFSPEEVDRRDRMQLSPDEKLERADYGVINNGSFEELITQLKAVADKLENNN